MQATQEGQARRGLAFEQDQDVGEIGDVYPLVEGLVILQHLPIADALLTHQQDKSVRLRDLIGEGFRPKAPGAQTRGREEHPSVTVLALKSPLQALGQRLIGRMVAEKPPSHSIEVSVGMRTSSIQRWCGETWFRWKLSGYRTERRWRG